MRAALIIALLPFASLHADMPGSDRKHNWIPGSSSLSEAIAKASAGLQQDPREPFYRDSLAQLIPQVEYPAETASLRNGQLIPFDLLTPIAKWRCIFCLNLLAGLALFLRLIGCWRWGHVVAWLFLFASLSCFFLMLFRDRTIARQFQSELLVLSQATKLHAGNGPHFDPVLPAALPAGHILKGAGERGGWLRVEYAAGKFGWVDEKAVIKVADLTPPR